MVKDLHLDYEFIVDDNFYINRYNEYKDKIL